MSASTAPSADGDRINLRVVLPGLMLAMLLAMLDNMIVTPALPRILGELGGVSHLSWVVTAYILGTTVSTPIWGKLGDLYGRKTIFLTSIVIFLVGSALCGVAGTSVLGGTDNGMIELIAFRAIQGLGAGGLLVGVMAILGDLVSPRERGKYQGQFAGIMAVAMVGGPLVGGLITDHLSWRWAFYVNIPLGGMVLVLLAAVLHLPKRRTEHRIDWFGAALLSVAVTSLVLITTWGGTEYAWASRQILGLVLLAAVTLALFVVVERRAAEPILPLRVLANRNFALITGVGFLLGFAMFGALSFLPLYQQTVQGASATNSGLLLLPIMVGAMVTSLVVGKAITRTGRYRIFPIVGGFLMIAAALLLAQLGVDTTRTVSALYMVVLGVGLGCLMQTTMLIAQNSADQRDLGVASSTATFFRSIGGSFGVALFGAVFSHRLADGLAARLGPDAPVLGDGAGASFDPAKLDLLPPPVREALFGAIADATSRVFWWSVPFALAVPLLAWFVREVPLRGPGDAPGATGETLADATASPSHAAEAASAPAPARPA
ncbi:MFS transporter [Pilimelia terevasa]|uniref:MFS transporter n=2 Tax=Pilimelia terevasa TaxID=53372 RepID=A0A8J3BGB1_9ACTN|nr:MFS transporter [Pilimelia terevasa]